MLFFLWDDSNIDHIAIHGITPEEAEQVLLNEPIIIRSEYRHDERRITYLGESDSDRKLVVIATHDDDFIRVVTAWPANARLRRFWDTQRKGKRDGSEAE